MELNTIVNAIPLNANANANAMAPSARERERDWKIRRVRITGLIDILISWALKKEVIKLIEI